MSRKITEKNAISILKTSKPRKGSYDRLQVAFDMAIKALEKQIPKKPIKHFVNPFGFPYYECPICGESDVCGQKYCDECGQKLDWSEEE